MLVLPYGKSYTQTAIKKIKQCLGVYKDLFCNTVSFFWVEVFMMMIWPILIPMRVWNQYSVKTIYEHLSLWLKIVATCVAHLPSQ